MTIPTEPIGSLPRPPELTGMVMRLGHEDPRLEGLHDRAICDTRRRFEEAGSPVIAGGERKIRCLLERAHAVQPDFTEARFAMKIAPSGDLLDSFVDLDNLALTRFTVERRARIGVHTCPGADRDSAHSAHVDYAEVLPRLFELDVGNFHIAFAREPDRRRVLQSIRGHSEPHYRVLPGVVDPIAPEVETPARYIPAGRLGTTDDCGYSPASDDTPTTRDAVFGKIRSRVGGTALAARTIGTS